MKKKTVYQTAGMAIAIGYAVDQNQPSIPIKQIINVPNDVGQRDEMLRQLFVEHVCDVDEEIKVTERKSDDDYGDIIVSWNDEVFMYLTFIS